MKFAVLFLVAMFFVGCASVTNRSLIIEGDSDWIAQVGKNGSHTIEGSGRRTVAIPTLGRGFCWSVQNQGGSYVRAYVDEGMFGATNKNETRVKYGVVSGCL